MAELRYADGPSTEVSAVIAAPAVSVWRFVTDIALPARFSSEFQGAEWLDGATEPSLGARFVGHNRHPAVGAWDTVSTICELEPARRFGWVVGDVDDPSAQWRFQLEESGGATTLSQWMRMGPARSGINAAIDAMPDKESRILERRLSEHRSNMAATLAGIKELAEA
jgi:hypothetical protein